MKTKCPECILSTDAYSDFSKYLDLYYPSASSEENRRLYDEYLNGSDKAYEELILRNIGLIRRVIKRYKFYLNPGLQMMDLINIGVEGLMSAIRDYDPEEGAFSTFVQSTIFWKLFRVVGSDLTEKPQYFRTKLKAYKELMEKCKMEGKHLTYGELKKMLHVSSDTLLSIINYINGECDSLNRTVYNGSEEELLEFIPAIEDDYVRVENDLDSQRLCVYLKDRLSPYKYYVLYHTVLVPKEYRVSEAAIGAKFGVLPQGINYCKQTSLSMIRKLYNPRLTGFRISNIKHNKKFNILPIDYDEFMRFLFLKDRLPFESQRLYELWLYRLYDCDATYYAKELELSVDQIYAIKDDIEAMKSEIDEQSQEYKDFVADVVSKRGTKLFAALPKKDYAVKQ